MTTEHIETAIIGAGQAGLATAYHLQRGGPPLPDPRRQCECRRQLARPLGLAAPLYPSSRQRSARATLPWSAMVVPHQGRGRRLSRGVRRTVFPPGANTRTRRPAASHGWKYLLRLGADSIVADNVVVATGTFGRTPSIPDFALI